MRASIAPATALLLPYLLATHCWRRAAAATENGTVAESHGTGPGASHKVPIDAGQSAMQPSLRGFAEGPDVKFVDDPDAEETGAKAPGIELWKPCTSAYRPCRNGYRMPSACASAFTYSGVQYDQCAPSSFGGSPWCSTDPTYSSWLVHGRRCLPCTEQSELPDDPALTVVAKEFACTPVVITGGSMAAGERVFTFINGFTPTEAQARFPVFSGGKWPGSVAIAGAVHTGHLSWDTRAAEVFDWWTKDSGDPKSRVTLRHLLQFSSGFYAPAMGHVQIPCMRVGSTATTMEGCAREVYEKASFSEDRLGKWSDKLNYNSMHQVVALAMATKRTGLSPPEYLQRYLYDPAGMTHTTVYPLAQPILSAFMATTVDDYDSFLSRYLTYKILPKDIVDVLEADSGNGAGSWISAMGHHTDGAVHDWGGSLYASVDRETQTYQLIVPPVKEYPGGAWGKWNKVHRLIESLIEHMDASHRRLASSFV